MKRLFFLHLAVGVVVFLACQVRQPHSEEQAFGKIGKSAVKASDTFAELASKMDGLLKGGKQTDYQELIGMLKKGNKDSGKATRAFRQLVEKPLDDLDKEIKILKIASKSNAFIAPIALKNAQKDVTAKIAALSANVKRHREAIYALAEHQSNPALAKSDMITGDVRVVLSSSTAKRWLKTLAESHPYQHDKLLEIALPVGGGFGKTAVKMSDREVIYFAIGLSTLGATYEMNKLLQPDDDDS